MATLLQYSLTNLSDVKESLGISSSDTTRDNLVIRKINQATRAIENYCGRRFALTAYTEVLYDATHTDELILRQRPITTFTSLESRDTSLNENSWDTVDTEFYFIDYASGIINLTFSAGGHWDSYRVSYTAGYGTIPEDLAEACASLASYYYNNADGSSVGVSEKREGQRTIKYSSSSSGNTTSFASVCQQLGIDEILNSYANNPVMTDR